MTSASSLSEDDTDHSFGGRQTPQRPAFKKAPTPYRQPFRRGSSTSEDDLKRQSPRSGHLFNRSPSPFTRIYKTNSSSSEDKQRPLSGRNSPFTRKSSTEDEIKRNPCQPRPNLTGFYSSSEDEVKKVPERPKPQMTDTLPGTPGTPRNGRKNFWSEVFGKSPEPSEPNIEEPAESKRKLYRNGAVSIEEIDDPPEYKARTFTKHFVRPGRAENRQPAASPPRPPPRFSRPSAPRSKSQNRRSSSRENVGQGQGQGRIWSPTKAPGSSRFSPRRHTTEIRTDKLDQIRYVEFVASLVFPVWCEIFFNRGDVRKENPVLWDKNLFQFKSVNS